MVMFGWNELRYICVSEIDRQLDESINGWMPNVYNTFMFTYLD